ncbi:glycosyltransferase [Pedobacter duraquae]|uniref:Colanic acid/amylovoran biosynthesis glycosyltransferase n=1 Tax=Pedobacter duraquae TaxID=425511 RepID=A0A4R6IBR7_9SPHI|nr:glycosyltransferase [Pedobacter duraquae]TDO19021.1 colanic acid/amylovoran biosynthesis glycosyltransferase [Pedobacter duraquae]
MKKKIVFILGSYPVISQPFLYNQILEVATNESYEVKIIVFNRTGEQIHKAYEALNDLVHEIILPSRLTLVNRVKSGVNSFFGLLFHNPISLLKSFNFVKFGRNSVNLNYLVLANGMKEVHADIFHCHFGPNARIIADLKDIGVINGKLLASFHGADITVYPRKFGENYYARLYRSFDLFTGNSGFIIDKMLANGCPKERTFKIPECLNVSKFKFRTIAPSRTVFKMLTVGRFVEKKGYQYSLKAAHLFLQNNIPFEYHVVGDGPLRMEMVEFAKTLGLENHVIFHGAMKQEDLVDLYNTVHVFMLPSVTAADGDTEGQGLVLQEAQAIGLPVLATLHNGFPDSILDGETGYLVPEKDSDSLYDKLTAFSTDVDLCNRMGIKGRSFVEQNFDSAIVVKDLIKLYDRLL